MAITIPPVNKSAFEDVMKALGGDDYSYYLFDVKNVEDKDCLLYTSPSPRD